MEAPAQVLDNLVQRNDGMIGVLELLAVLLVLETWKETLQYARWQAYIDNDGVLYSIINASSRASDVNLIVGKLWKSLHTLSTDLIAFRIESKANIGDAPSRVSEEEELHDLKYLGALSSNQGYHVFFSVFGQRPRTMHAIYNKPDLSSPSRMQLWCNSWRVLMSHQVNAASSRPSLQTVLLIALQRRFNLLCVCVTEGGL